MYTPHQLITHLAILLIAFYFKTLLKKQYPQTLILDPQLILFFPQKLK
jgi:hypothetical protein